MNTADALATLSAAGLASVSNDLSTLLQPSIRITSHPASEATLPVGGSKLGGLPDLPAGAAWPQGKGLPLSFIAQIRLEDVQPYDTQHALPPTGLLSFFYDAKQQTYGADPNDRGGWQVLYHAGDASGLQRLAAPAALPAGSRFTACAVTFSADMTLPQQPELDRPTLAWTADQKKAYENALATFPTPADHAATHNRLLGNPDTIQDDMRAECQLAANGVSDASDPRAAALAAGANNWRLLLQVDSDSNAGMRWADAGMLYFWIERAALESRRFDNVWVVLQSD